MTRPVRAELPGALGAETRTYGNAAIRASAVADHLADECRASVDGGQQLRGALCRFELLWIKSAPSARGPGLRAALARRPRRVSMSRALPSPRDRNWHQPGPGVRPPVRPSPRPLDCPATTTQVKSAPRPYGIGKPTPDMRRAGLGWQLSGGRGRSGGAVSGDEIVEHDAFARKGFPHPASH